MSHVRRLIMFSLLVPALAFALVACDDDDDGEPTATASASASASASATGEATFEAGVVNDPPDGATEVEVTLREWAVEPATASILAGETYFLASNEGPNDPHELVVIRTDLALDALPTDERGFVQEDGEGIELIGEIEGFAPGTSASGVFDLGAGRYVLICNIIEQEDGEWESHYRQGMATEFTVE